MAYGYYVNGQLHVNIIKPFIKVINMHNSFPVYWFKLAIVISSLDLYVFLGYYLPIQPLLKNRNILCLIKINRLTHF